MKPFLNKTIFDPVRRKHVARTPEEEVRQFVIRYLTDHCQIPLGYISVETGFHVFEKFCRSDIQVRNRKGEAVMLIECKRPSVSLNDGVLEQAMRYNLHLQERYIIITNGLEFRCFEHHPDSSSENRWIEKDRYPQWSEINSLQE